MKSGQNGYDREEERYRNQNFQRNQNSQGDQSQDGLARHQTVCSIRKVACRRIAGEDDDQDGTDGQQRRQYLTVYITFDEQVKSSKLRVWPYINGQTVLFYQRFLVIYGLKR